MNSYFFLPIIAVMILAVSMIPEADAANPFRLSSTTTDCTVTLNYHYYNTDFLTAFDLGIYYRAVGTIQWQTDYSLITNTYFTADTRDLTQVFNFPDEQSYEIKLYSRFSHDPNHWFSATPIIQVDHPCPSPEPAEASNGNSNDCYDCTAPELISLKLNNSTTWNNQTIGESQSMTFIYYENKGSENIKWMDIALGLKSEYNPFYDGEVKMEFKIDNATVIESEIIDENNILTNSTILSVEDVTCSKGTCLQGTLHYTFAEKTFYDYGMIRVSDYRGNTDYQIIAPIKVIGQTINDQPTVTFQNTYQSTKKYGDTITVTRTDKISDMWIDTHGYEWKHHENGSWEKIWNWDSIEKIWN